MTTSWLDDSKYLPDAVSPTDATAQRAVSRRPPARSGGAHRLPRRTALGTMRRILVQIITARAEKPTAPDTDQ